MWTSTCRQVGVAATLPGKAIDEDQGKFKDKGKGKGKKGKKVGESNTSFHVAYSNQCCMCFGSILANVGRVCMLPFSLECKTHCMLQQSLASPHFRCACRSEAAGACFESCFLHESNLDYRSRWIESIGRQTLSLYSSCSRARAKYIKQKSVLLVDVWYAAVTSPT